MDFGVLKKPKVSGKIEFEVVGVYP